MKSKSDDIALVEGNNELNVQMTQIAGEIGDLNDDAIVDWADAAILAQYLVGYPIPEISPLPEAEFLRRADFNGDGIVDIADVLALARTLPPEEKGVTYLPL